MTKPLTEMSLTELWQLFPITRVPHHPCWGSWYQQERQHLTALLVEEKVRIHHISSTAISGIWAKTELNYCYQNEKI